MPNSITSLSRTCIISKFEQLKSKDAIKYVPLAIVHNKPYGPKVGTGGASGGGEEGAVGGADGISGTPPSRQLLGRRDSTSFDTSRHGSYIDALLQMLSCFYQLKVRNNITSLQADIRRGGEA